MANQNDFEYVNGMILYFDRQGNLKEQINDIPLRQGNSGVNKIYVFWEEGTDENIIGLWSRYTRTELSSIVSVPTATTYYDEYRVVENGRIPYNSKRDLKFFKYYQNYKFYEITIPDSVLGVGDTTWLCSLWFVLDRDNDRSNNGITYDPNNNVSGYNESEVNIYGMGGITFYVIPSGFSIAPDENINVAQWNYLMSRLGVIQDFFNRGVGELAENIKTFSGRETDKTGLAFTDESGDDDIDYKVVLGGEFYNAYFYDRTIGEEIRFSDMYDDIEDIKLDIPLLAKDLVVSMDTSNYQITFTLKNLNNQTISTQTLDLPLESVVVSGSYNSQTESIILTLQNGNTISIPVGDLVNGLVSSDYLTNNYYNKTTMDSLLDAKANQVQLVATTTRLDNEISGLKTRATTLEFDVSALKTNSAFTYNSTTQEYEAKSDINMKGLDIDGVMELFSADVFTANLYGLNDSDILLRSNIDGNQKTIKNIYLETPNITLTPPEDSSAFIYVGDESILSVDEYQNVIIGCDNAGSLTFETQNNSVDFDDLMTTLNAKASQVELASNVARLDNDISGIKERTTILESQVQAINLTRAFTYDGANQKYVARGNIDIGSYGLYASDIYSSKRNPSDTKTYNYLLAPKEIDSTELISEMQVKSLDNTYTLFSVVAPDTQPKEATITTKVENSGANNDETYFMDISTMNYGNVDEAPEESIYIQSRNASVKPNFNIGYTDETQTRHKKLIITHDALPMMFTSTGIWVKNTNDKSVHGWANRTEVDLRDINANKSAIVTINTTLDNKVDKRTTTENLPHLYAYGKLDGSAVLDMTASKESYNGTLPIRDGNVGIKSNTIDSMATAYNNVLTNIEWIKNHTPLLQPSGVNQNYDGTIYQIYGHTPMSVAENQRNAMQYCFNVSNTPSQATIPQYDSNSNLKSSTPIANNDVATKQYVDNHSPSITPTLLGTAQNQGYGNLDFSFSNVDLTTKQGLGVLTFGNCQILINLYGLQKGTTYYQPATFRVSGSTTSSGVRQGMLAYTYNTDNSFACVFLEWNGSSWTNAGSGVTYTAYLFLVNLK